MRRTAAGLVLSGLVLFTWLAARASPPPTTTLTPEYQASFSTEQQLLLEILKEMKGLREDLKVAVDRGQVKTSGALVARDRCGKCHGDIERPKGDFSFVKADGTLRALSGPDRRSIREQVEKGAMPPGAALPATERKALLELIDKGDVK